MTITENTEDIKQTLLRFSDAISNKDVDSAYAIFDYNAKVILAGSSKDELHRGNEAIKTFLLKFLSKPFRVSWDLSNIIVDSNNDTGWAFADGKAILKHDNGSEEEMPYRIAIVAVKKGSEWKWRLFNGSVPEGD